MIRVNLLAPSRDVHTYESLNEIFIVISRPGVLWAEITVKQSEMARPRARKARCWTYLDDLGRLRG